MSDSPETEFDLEKLFLPAWAQEPAGTNKYAGFAGEDRRDERPNGRQGFQGRPSPRRGPPGQGDSRPRSGKPPERRPEGRDRARPGERRHDHDRRPDQDRRPEVREALPLPKINVVLLPDEKGLDSLARQIRITGRAYPLFDIAQLVLQKPERQQVRWEVVKNPEGKPFQPLFLCALDDSLWLSEDEAVSHLLGRNFEMFYQAEKTATEPPKGTYTFVAQCGMSGIIFGPPNYHDYQSKLHKLHTERFSRMPFEAFKARVKIVRDEAVVKKWIEDQSTKTEYICLNLPEALKLPNREAVEKHFREVHLPNLIKPVDSHSMSGPASRQLRSPGLQRLLRHSWEEQRRFPLQLATTLSQQFAARGLQFFKVNRTVTHVSVARPHYLDMEATPVSEGVRRIVEFINKHPKCSRRKLNEALAPMPPAASVAPVAPAPAPVEGAAPVAEPVPPPVPEASPEQTALAGDLHWLIHQGHVIEFANGILETAKKPLPRPPKPEPKIAPAKQPQSETAPVQTTAPAAETAPTTEAADATVVHEEPVVEVSTQPGETHETVPATPVAVQTESQPGETSPA